MEPLLIAHRGDSAHAPENTLGAFAQAIAKGCDWIETDLQLARGENVVSFHDDTLDRLTSRRGRPQDLDAEELTSLTVLAGRFPAATNARICTLDDILEGPGQQVPFYLELKSNGRGRSDSVNRRLLDSVLAKVPADSPHALASFDADLVRGAIDAGRPGIHIVNHPRDVPADLFGRLFAASVRFSGLDADFIEQSHDAGVAVWTWTVDAPRDVERCRALGVDGICTNDVGLVRSLLTETP